MSDILIPSHELSLTRVMRQMADTGCDMLIVISDQGKLSGIIREQEVLRALLNGRQQVQDAIIPHPPKIMGQPGQTAPSLPCGPYRYLPVVNERNEVASVLAVNPRYWRYRSNPVVIMAGGRGRRMGHLTRNLPKPMLPLGTKPVLQRLLESLLERGFGQFYFCVNYKAEVIQEYFGDGSQWHAQIRYVTETEPLGTAASLRLIADQLQEPFVVLNGDLVTTLNFESLLDFHLEKEAQATMCLHEYSYQLPFGVVHTRQSQVLSLEEKPFQQHAVNAGIYVLNPESLEYLPQEGPSDMTDVLAQMLAAEQAVHAYHINEFWMDIGRPQDYEQVQGLFDRLEEGKR